MQIAIIGANGFVGKNIVNVLKKKHKIIKISKKTKFEKLKGKFDVIIHSANSSKKYEATKYPLRDFKNSVKLTKKIIDHFGDKKIILISTISVKDKKNIYSINRKLCEDYMKSLVWTTHYYFDKCCDWRFSTKYNEAPLTEHLFRYITNHKIELEHNDTEFSNLEQLSYIFPQDSHHLHKHDIVSKDYQMMIHYQSVLQGIQKRLTLNVLPYALYHLPVNPLMI